MPSLSGRILLICDDEKISGYLREILIIEGGHSVSCVISEQEGLNALKQNGFDLVIVKFGELNEAAVNLIKSFKKIDPDCIMIAFLEKQDDRAAGEFSRLGIYDFISRPINATRLFFLVRKGIELHTLMAANRKLCDGFKEHNVSLEKQNTLLAKRIEESTNNLTRLYEDLRTTYMRTIKVLAQAIEARDAYTHSHSENVAKYAVTIGREMGLSAKELETLREACELHDLGKIGIEDKVLSKPSGLTEEEWKQVRKHPTTGAQILEPLTFLNDVIEIVRQHHEHYDGSGYPEGRKGDDILIGARVLHIADAYEAMRSARSYRKTPLSREDAVAEIKKNSGKQFDPHVVEVFLKVVNKL